MRRGITQLVTFASLLIVPTCNGQFGIPKMNKKGGSSFEDLQERANAMQDGGAGGAGGSMADMLGGLGDIGGLADMFNDPTMAKAMEDAMKEFQNMSPDEIQAKMAEAMSQLTSPDIIDTVMDKKDEVLANLKATGLVSDEQIKKYEEDPELFEKEMKSSFEQMGAMFKDPDAMNNAMKNMNEFMEPMMKEYENMLLNTDEDKIEEARLELLKNPELMKSNPLFDSDEFADAIKDKDLWLEAVKKGQETILKEMQEGKAKMGAGGGGAGIGEL